MTRCFHYEITSAYDGITIGQYLKRREYSRHIVIHLKKRPEAIHLNGQHAWVNDSLHPGDVLDIRLYEEESSPNIIPVPLPLHIIYEDDDLIIVNKPADMPVHPSQHNHDNTVANALMFYYEQQHQPFVFRCISRLDRDTTGLLIIAKHMLSASLLSDMMARREIHREYLAIVTGKLPAAGTITAPIARLPGSAIARCVDNNGAYARTNYRRMNMQNDYSLAALRLETGRTHQIRVHMKHIGHPLTGDFLYNPDYDADNSAIKRQALHSWRLSFIHPVTKEPLHFTAPPAG